MKLDQAQVSAIVRREQAKWNEENKSPSIKEVSKEEAKALAKTKKELLEVSQVVANIIYNHGAPIGSRKNVKDQRILDYLFPSRTPKPIAAFDYQKLSDEITIAMIDVKDIEELKKKLKLTF